MSRTKFFVLLLAIALLTVACSQKPATQAAVPPDAKLAGDVQTRITADPQLANRQVTISVKDGVVTLSGTLSSDAEVTAALNDAQQAEGARMIVSRLQVQSAAPVEPPKEEVAVNRSPAPAPRRVVHSAPVVKQQPMQAAPPRPVAANAEFNNQGPMIGSSPAPVVAAAPAPAPEIKKVSVPAGTEIQVRTIEPLSSETSQADQIFHGTLNASVTVDGEGVIPAGADVEGRIVEVHPSTHYSGSSLLVLQLSKLSYAGHAYAIATEQWMRKGEARGTNTAKKVGTGAAIGAVIGGIIGGGKGAAVGAATGAGAGAGANTMSKGQPIDLHSESLIVFRLASSVTVLPSIEEANHRTRLTVEQPQ